MLYIIYNGKKIYFEDSFAGFKECQLFCESKGITKTRIYHED